ncbi:MAG TPA: DUF1801 domain-containing protein [Ktedonobacterales bacterium]|jgi:uncharacterized protein YdhG (YjbR/CyaY superfamily)
MDSKSASYQTIDEYIAQFPADIQALLAAVRATIRAAAPDAQERIAYQMPTFAQQGNLVHFAAMKGYIGFYPTSSGVEAFQTELAPYASTKGAVHFPFDQPLPLDLIRRITEFRVRENLKRAAARAKSGRTGSARP